MGCPASPPMHAAKLPLLPQRPALLRSANIHVHAQTLTYPPPAPPPTHTQTLTTPHPHPYTTTTTAPTPRHTRAAHLQQLLSLVDSLPDLPHPPTPHPHSTRPHTRSRAPPAAAASPPAARTWRSSPLRGSRESGPAAGPQAWRAQTGSAPPRSAQRAKQAGQEGTGGRVSGPVDGWGWGGQAGRKRACRQCGACPAGAAAKPSGHARTLWRAWRQRPAGLVPAAAASRAATPPPRSAAHLQAGGCQVQQV